MSTKKEEPSKPETTEQRPKAPPSGELSKEQLDEVTGGTTGGSGGVPLPPPRGVGGPGG